MTKCGEKQNTIVAYIPQETKKLEQRRTKK